MLPLIKYIAKGVASVVGHFKRIAIISSLVPMGFNAMRLGSPVGWILLAMPGYWGLIWGGGHYSVALWITAGAIWARSLGCFYNDWVDRSLDAKVVRTRHRPLVAKPPSWGIVRVMIAIFVLGSGIFGYYLPFSCTIIAGVGLIGTLIYPWSKRFTYYPQILLGLIFNLTIWMPACITHAPFSMGLWVLYAYGVIWTVSYDTVYAFQDFYDDGAAGVYSLALKMGPKKGHCVLGLLFLVRFAVLLVLLLGAGSPSFGGRPASWSAYIATLFMVAVQWNIWRKWDLSSPIKCHDYFKYSIIEGVQLCVVLILVGKVNLKWFIWFLDLVG